ncbi:hydrolase 1, exosortase A system-associated [Sphingomonas lacunae]|uniref:Hydrolase 1, exosortase A system-associated n=1 Tax=Sphingomonas lacunae TaxID=2698828 RepID=A0A6M4B003_9SPHN|nr:hydrolase 1, exosortase A system-associated [Sphingomonas lacunae]QJQ32631.1 hydrolase 1, exosortase A system-associated [Sphingomonas lacunae]
MRRWLSFDVEGAECAATLDEAGGATGLLIVSGGNEIRCGAHRGMARLAAMVAEAGHPVLRFDRRGIGDSEGENGGFESSAADIAAAIALFRRECPQLTKIVGFGNCDAASALVLHHRVGGVDAMILGNPWTIEVEGEVERPGASTGKENAVYSDSYETTPLPPAAAIRARYWAKLKDPREWLRLLRGGVDLRKLAKGLGAAGKSAPPSGLAARLAAAGAAIDVPMTVLIATRDGTAQAFMAEWTRPHFKAMRAKARIESCDTGSHSFADAASRDWLEARVLEALRG